MWREKSPEELRQVLGNLQEMMNSSEISDRRLTQFERVHSTISEHLGGLAIDTETAEDVEVDTDETEATDEEDLEEDSESSVADKQDTFRGESGASGVWGGRRRGFRRKEVTNSEIAWLKMLGYGGEARRGGRPVNVVRFDPEKGTFGPSGGMLADATESPSVRANLSVVIEVADYLSKLSHQIEPGEYFLRRDLKDILAQLGHEGLDPLPQRILIRELCRVLNPSRSVTIMKDRSGTHMVEVHNPFMFIVTDVETGVYSRGVDSESGNEPLCCVEEWPAEGLTDQELISVLAEGRLPRPANHLQSEQLLSVIMTGDTIHNALAASLKKEAHQAVTDLAHCFVLECMGWDAYDVARKTRTIRSGKSGFSGVVRQVTGVQEQERFEKGSQAPTA